MRGHSRILAGTALATLMVASASAMADTRPDMTTGPALLLAQAEGEQPAAAQEPAGAEPAAEPEQPRKPRKQRAERQAPAEAQPAEAAPAEQAAEPEQPKAEKRRKQRAEQPAEAQPAEAAPAEQAAEPEQPKAEKRRKQQAEQQPAEAAEPAPTEQAAEPEQPKAEKRRKQRAEQQPAESEPAEAAPAEQAAEPEQPKAEKRRKQRAEQQPAGETPVQSEAPNDGGTAPVLDSQKQPPAPPAEAKPAQPATGEGQQTAQPTAPEAPPAPPAGPPPADDKAAQEAVQPAEIQPVTAEQGKRRERRQDDDEPRRRERPKGSEVLREIGDRLIIQFNNQVIVESNDRPRMSRGARDVYYEDLPRGRTRETIVRRDGTRVVTVRNAYGDVIRRSRIAPDDREYVLVYVEEDNYDRVRDWRDPGRDLPPMRLDIPEDEYILDAATAAEEPDTYYTFLEQPPVERVERLYSVDEVKRSARIRDKTRRVDLDTLTFEFGSSSIPEDQIAKLDGVAQAMEKLLQKNPAETFLIEGHTDAVGSDLANLALSDRRAEAVADALTDVFAIPPENLATQGYGEQYLKVRTQAPERENRRVAIRRITPLVAPVASAN